MGPRESEATDVRVALLRGINVGKAKRISMAELKKVLEGLGYAEVRTLLNSGNVVFTVPGNRKEEPAGRIEEAILRRLGVSTRVIVLTKKEVKAIIRGNPLARLADSPSRLLLMVLPHTASAASLREVASRDWTPESIALEKRVAYLWCPGGIIKSRLIAAVNRVLKDAGTARNIATMTKLHAMMDE